MPPAGVIRRRPCRRRWLAPTSSVYRLSQSQTVRALQAVSVPLERSLSVPPRGGISRFGRAECAAVSMADREQVPPPWRPRQVATSCAAAVSSPKTTPLHSNVRPNFDLKLSQLVERE
jgi:hypothetical protein